MENVLLIILFDVAAVLPAIPEESGAEKLIARDEAHHYRYRYIRGDSDLLVKHDVAHFIFYVALAQLSRHLGGAIRTNFVFVDASEVGFG